MEHIILQRGKTLKYYQKGVYQGCYYNFNKDVTLDINMEIRTIMIASNGAFVSFTCDTYEITD